MTRPTHPFEVRSRDVWRIALPASVAFITEPLAGIVDLTIIGRLGDPNLLGGVVLGALIFDVIYSLAYFLRIGTAGLTAQAVGARDPNDGLIHFARALLLAVLLGVLMIALSMPIFWAASAMLAPAGGVGAAMADYFYVRIWSAPFSLINYALLGWFYGRASAKTGMLLQILIHCVDMALSMAFVYWLDMGVPGAALGTVLAHMVAAALGLYLVARHFGGLRGMLGRIVPQELTDRLALKRMFGLSRDLLIRSLALMSAYAYFAAQGSRAGEVTLSSNAILLNILMVSGFFLDGLAQASEQLCGKAVGANWRPAFDKAVRLSMIWGLVIAGGLALFWLLAGSALIDVMTTNAAVREQAMMFLVLAALSALTGMPAFVMDGILTGATLNAIMRNGMVVALVLFLASVMVLQPILGNTGLWLALHIFFVARGLIYWFAMERHKPALFKAQAQQEAEVLTA